MIPEVGATCSFAFIAKFAPLNGVFRIRAETTFADAVASGVDFISNLYTPAGLQLSDFNDDYSSYAQDRVAVLESVIDSSIVYYAPESIFLTVPDSTIKEFLPLILVVNLGIHENTQAIYPLLDQIKDLIQATLGTEDPLRVVTNPQNKVYLTSSEYDALVAAREANIQTLIPLSVQLRQLQTSNVILATKCSGYEALIAEQATA